jgi:hypothetical protein
MRRLSGSRYYSPYGELPKPLHKVRERSSWTWAQSKLSFHRETTQTPSCTFTATIVSSTNPGVSGQCAQRYRTHPTRIRWAAAINTNASRDQIPDASRHAAEAAASTRREDGRFPSPEHRKRCGWYQSGGYDLDYGTDRQVHQSGQVSVCSTIVRIRNISLSTISSYEVEDIEPQEDGKSP